jgi:hypothetical protein
LNCVFHSEVPGIGICISCRRVVCDPCSTRLQGRNFCSECLSLRALGGQDSEAPASSLAGRFGLGLLALLSSSVLVLAVFAVGFFLYMIG